MRARTKTDAGQAVATARRSPGLFASLRVLPRMAGAIRRGEYRPATFRVLLALVTLGYVVSPVDVLPEVILGPLGMADDVTLAVTAGAALLAAETSRFLEWERTQLEDGTPTAESASR